MRMVALIRNLFGLVCSLFFITPIFAEQPTFPLKFNMTRGVTPMSRDQYYLHMSIFWICVAIGVIVFAVLIYSLIKHRKSKDFPPAQFHSSTKVEVIWAVIPFLILMVMAIPATIVLLRMGDEAKADLNIKVTGYQWKWKYDYLDQGISFYSNLSTPRDQIEGKAPKGRWYLLEVDKPLVVPIHKKIRFLVTSNDVIHSWWVPALGIKRDAIPGFIHESWARIEKPGVYRGQCAELCGINHAYMPIVVIAKTQTDFDKWVAQKTKVEPEKKRPPAADLNKKQLMTEGKKVYDEKCAVCHKTDGSGMPPAFPALKGGKITTGPVAAHIDIVLNGKKGTAMQAFGDQLSDQEIAAVVTYERNAWGNDNQTKYGENAGGLVQPKEVALAKGEKITEPEKPSKEPAKPPEKPSSKPKADTTQKAPSEEKKPAPADEDMTKEALMKEGEKVYTKTCSVCHQPTGKGMPPTFPSLIGAKITTGPIPAHLNIVLNGKKNTTMQAFAGQLNDKEIAAVITYERNSWGNDDQNKFGKNAGGIVQPQDVAKARKQ